MKQRLLIFILGSIVITCAIFIGYQISKQQVKNKEAKIESLQLEKHKIQDKNDDLSQLVKRQSKTVISEEEKQIRETCTKFVKDTFDMKKGTSFKDKEANLKPLITNHYYDILFKNNKNRYDLYDDITVDDIHVYFDMYEPSKDSYKVFVQFDERIETEGQNKIEHSITSVQLDLIRTNSEWRIDNLKRFDLKPLGH